MWEQDKQGSGKGIGHYRNGDRQIYFDGRYEYVDGNMGEINDLKKLGIQECDMAVE